MKPSAVWKALKITNDQAPKFHKNNGVEVNILELLG